MRAPAPAPTEPLLTARPRAEGAERMIYRELRAVLLPRAARPICEFAEQEIILPEDSTHRAGRRYSYDLMPCKRLLHESFMDRRWRRRFWSGPSQVSGKTLDLEIALMYHLFELGHSCAIGAPDVDMIQANLWEPKLKPLITASRYREYLPARGQGSQGGKFRAMHFRHGPHLYFMGAGGSDSQRVSLTFRALFLTELDQLSQRSGASIESSPARSMEDRVRGWGVDACVYGECVVHTRHDLIWQESEGTPDGRPTGSGGRVLVRCPACGHWFFPERGGLVGWQGAESEEAARAGARYACPECSAALAEADRARMLADPRLVHRGQAVDERGQVAGPRPPTETFGFRTNAFHCLISLAEVAALEWRAARSETDADARNLANNVWNEPWDPEAEAGAAGRELTANFVREKVGPFEQRVVPAAAEVLTLGVDVGKYLCSWMAPAWRKDAAGWLVDAGEVPVPTGARSPELAVEAALSEFLEVVLQGWPPQEVVPEVPVVPKVPELVLIDSGYWPDVVHRVCRAFTARGLRVLPCKGWGSTGRRSPFRAPKPGGEVQVGQEWFISRQPDGLWLVNVNVDHWKRWVQARLATPPGPAALDPLGTTAGALQPGSLVLWKPPEGARMEHMATAKSAVSEIWREFIHKTKGLVAGWKVQSPTRTHRLDALGYAACAADICGVKLLAPPPAPPAAPNYPASAPDRNDPGWKIGR